VGSGGTLGSGGTWGTLGSGGTWGTLGLGGGIYSSTLSYLF
jgi:hypothetical protein